LKARIPDFVQSSQKGLFTCPVCKQLSANIYPPKSGIVHCFAPECQGKIGDIFDICRTIDFQGQDLKDEDIADLLIEELHIKTDNKIKEMLQKYSEWGWSLVPCEKGTKKANIENGWQEKEHRSILEWQGWLDSSLNIGINGGKISNCTVIDIDTKNPPEFLQQFLNKTLTQTSAKGFHLFYLYEESLPSMDFRDTTTKLPVEIRNDKRMTIIYPSIAENKERSFNDLVPIKMPQELKDWLQKIALEKPEEKKEIITSEKIEDIFNDIKINGLQGNCNNAFTKFGGLLRKRLNDDQTEYCMNIVNDLLLDKPMAKKEMKAMCQQLKKYGSGDYTILKKQVLDYLIRHEEASGRDLNECIKVEMKDIKEVLAQLIQEQKVFKLKSLYKAVQKPEWKTDFVSESRVLDYEIPYFNSVGTFRVGDLIIIGAATGVGKSYLALNIIKKFVDQGQKKLFYVSSEPGNRFSNIALSLGMKDGDFNFCNNYSPEKLELEDDAITIYDWILAEQYCDTAQLYKIFSRQLDRHRGILFIFAQLRDNGTFYASEMTRFFASFACRYFYTKSGNITDNVHTYFQTDKIREPKGVSQEVKIPTIFNKPFLELRKNT
jgi:hypothetical protein